MKVPEPTHSLPCEHCGGDHKEWLCPYEYEEESSYSSVDSDYFLIQVRQ